eukprot:scaffold241042_cov50-Prasinocladus_malaysianus.AAC.1
MAQYKMDSDSGIITCVVQGCGEMFIQTTRRPIRICSAHRTSEQFIIDGEASRYCQQCSRPHSLSRFTDTRRGCNLRLTRRRNRYGKPSDIGILHTYGSFQIVIEDWMICIRSGGMVSRYTFRTVVAMSLGSSTWPGPNRQRGGCGAVLATHGCDRTLAIEHLSSAL